MLGLTLPQYFLKNIREGFQIKLRMINISIYYTSSKMIYPLNGHIKVGKDIHFLSNNKKIIKN